LITYLEKMWNNDKKKELRNLKKLGYTDKMLIEHFGDEIYQSGLYNKVGSSLPSLLKFGEFINEISINPEICNYSFIKQPSKFIRNESDYIISFFSNDIPYIISLMYFPINDKITYNIVFTTRDQWNDYEYKLMQFLKIGKISEVEFEILDDIISKETKLNDLYPIFKKISWILNDFYNKNIENQILSIGETKNKTKIKLYRNIIKDSFKNIEESQEEIHGNNYYLYKIKTLPQ
jgi:hypothetical protein